MNQRKDRHSVNWHCFFPVIINKKKVAFTIPKQIRRHFVCFFSKNLAFFPEIFMSFSDILGHFVSLQNVKIRCKKKLG